MFAYTILVSGPVNFDTSGYQITLGIVLQAC
jgi:hypothetical protein